MNDLLRLSLTIFLIMSMTMSPLVAETQEKTTFSGAVDIAQSKIHETPLPDWVQATGHTERGSLSTAGSTGLLLYEKQVHIPSRTRFFRTVQHLNSPSAVQSGSVLEIDFDPSYQAVHLHSCKIRRGNHDIDKLPTASKRLLQRESLSHQYIYSGIWTLVVILEDVREGDALEYAYSIEGSYPVIGDYFQDAFTLSSERGIPHIYARLIGLRDDVSIKHHGHRFQPATADLEGGLREWVWDIPEPKEIKTEPEQPDWFEPHHWAQISTFASWHEVAEQARYLFVEPSELSPAINSQLQTWKEENPDPVQLITQIVRFVQNKIRYLSLDERVAAYRAADPNDVFNRRFGDCKDKSWLLCLLLREVGVPSHPALVSNHWEHKVADHLPNLGSFNHAIAAIEHQGKTYWIDATHSNQGGTLETMAQAQYGSALVIGKPKTSLVDLTDLPTKHKVDTFVTFDFSKPDDVTMQVEAVHTSGSADGFRNYRSHYTLDEITEYFADFYNGHYKNVSVVNPVTVQDSFDENITTTKALFAIADCGVKSSDARKITYSIWPLSMSDAVPDKIDLKRKTPLALPYPLERFEEIRVKVPPIDDLFTPTHQEFRNEYVEYRSDWLIEDNNTYRLVYSLRWLKDHIPAEDLAKLQPLMEIFDHCGITVTTAAPGFETRSKGDGLKMLWRGLLIFFAIGSILRLFPQLSKLFGK